MTKNLNCGPNNIDNPTSLVNCGVTPVTAVNCGATLVYDVAQLPIITCPANISVNTGVVVNATATNTGGVVPAGGWSIAPALPAGLTFNANTGQITGTPTVVSANNTYTITATNIDGSDTCTFDIEVVAVLVAPNITCPVNQSLTTGTAMVAVTPTNTGGAVATWSIAPALPAGLAFNTTTGQVTGTPTAASANTTYTVTATNATGSDTCTFDIEVVNALAAPNITCPPNQTLQTGVAMTVVSSTNAGGAIPAGGWSIAPALPAALSFNTNTGQISGTPSADFVSTIYTVTATNATGSDTCTLNIESTTALAAPNITCPLNQTFTVGTAITAIAPTNSGGVVPAGGYSIAPALPAGLNFNVNTGQITGTATAASANATYTITATNATGSDTCTFDVAVVAGLAAPNITCPANQTLNTGVAMTAVSATNAGGAVPAGGWSIAPALPAALSFNTNTGQISGTPSADFASTTYTVTATNATGSDTCTLDIQSTTALAVPNITCPINQAFTVGTNITAISPTNSGGAVQVGGYSIAPALPAGLAFNANTGQITGTPIAASPNTTYTITATNATGSDACTFDISVANALAVPNITCPANQSLTVGDVVNVTATNSGGAVATWAIAPALPAGLSFNTSTGAVTGTATAVSANATYTITATNATGSDTCTFDVVVVAALAAPNITCPANISIPSNGGNATGTVTNSGGAVATWAIAPATAGVSISPTGVITVDDGAVLANNTYTVTATNATGSDTCTLDIEVTPPVVLGTINPDPNASLLTLNTNNAVPPEETFLRMNGNGTFLFKSQGGTFLFNDASGNWVNPTSSASAWDYYFDTSGTSSILVFTGGNAVPNTWYAGGDASRELGFEVNSAASNLEIVTIWFRPQGSGLNTGDVGTFSWNVSITTNN